MSQLVQPLKWHGGKHYLASWIIEMMPPHLHYVEPYFGGGSVLLRRDPARDWLARNDESLPAHLRGCSEAVNDINGELMNFWRTMQDPQLFEQFSRRVQATPFSEIEFVDAGANVNTDPVARAVAFFVRSRHSRQGLSKDFATLSRNRTRSRRSEQANSWWTCVDGLFDVYERLRGVIILNRDAVDAIRQQDGPISLFYCDPPYLHETRSTTKEYGRFEMNVSDHRKLLETLAGIKGSFLLSGYRSALYDEFAERCGWRREEKLIDNKASSAGKKERKTECLWMNFEADSHSCADAADSDGASRCRSLFGDD